MIDILVGVAGLAESRAAFEPLAELEYLYAPYRAYTDAKAAFIESVLTR